jgi:hypothetical protein
MGSTFLGGIYVVAATKDGKTDYWVAATRREDAVIAVELLLGPGWTVALTDRRVSPQQIDALKLRPNGVCQLKSAQS